MENEDIKGIRIEQCLSDAFEDEIDGIIPRLMDAVNGPLSRIIKNFSSFHSHL